MSGGTACVCAERAYPLSLDSGQPRRWLVTARGYHRSAFAGGRRTPSDYSAVLCLGCGRIWRTRAGYVAILADAPDDWPRLPIGPRQQTDAQT